MVICWYSCDVSLTFLYVIFYTVTLCFQFVAVFSLSKYRMFKVDVFCHSWDVMDGQFILKYKFIIGSNMYVKYIWLPNFIGATVAECLRSLSSNHSSLAAVGSYHGRVFGFFHVMSSYPANLRNVGGSTQLPEIIHGGVPDILSRI
jgi:hypothetical protein